MDFILLLAIVGVLFWMVAKRRNQAGAGLLSRFMGGGFGGAAQQQPQGTMPRIGTPGTITDEQFEELSANNFQPSRLWSREEAELILDAVTYTRAACEAVTGDGNPPIEVQNQILHFILGDETLRTYIRQWGRGRPKNGEPVRLRRNQHFHRVAAHIKTLWEPED